MNDNKTKIYLKNLGYIDHYALRRDNEVTFFKENTDAVNAGSFEDNERIKLANKVMEECAELIHAICKDNQYRWNNYHPETPTISNERQICEELADVKIACANLEKFFWNDL